ncbi:hypothetical protein H9Y04_27105 [Streptomyces sp. TRM66268-LWL]|uniref:Secreted protein n=1 Tax=Streptomyces polyasparticus TaxID=2767826 RepID=A0ABR7SL89_9ACTN|nr:hypothetical protein [Streptomyces polyasparticus]MBC9716212.1 hypothetical protein [Streptomyces polyasparticus]
MLKSLGRKATAAAPIAALMLALTPGAASAHHTECEGNVIMRIPAADGVKVAGACMEPHGETLRVRDYKADGYGARAQAYRKVRTEWVKVGGVCFDDTSTGNPDRYCDLAIAETTDVKIRLWEGAYDIWGPVFTV